MSETVRYKVSQAPLPLLKFPNPIQNKKHRRKIPNTRNPPTINVNLESIKTVETSRRSSVLSRTRILFVPIAAAIFFGVIVGISVGFALRPLSTTITTTTVTFTTATTTTTVSTATTSTTTTDTSTTTTTATTTTTTTVTTTTSATTTTTGLPLTCGSGETVYAVWNTTADGNSMPSASDSNIGNYYPSEIASYTCDGNLTTRYTNFGPCNSSTLLSFCGLNSGFYRTPQRGASLITGLRICTSPIRPIRDPLTVTLKGSNQPASALNLGSSWTLLYSGVSGLATDPGRSACGIIQNFSNTVWYSSYRFVVTSKRGADSCASYAEVQLIGI